jgi:uncharacterized membrane protein HdeD (DUF308 family)
MFAPILSRYWWMTLLRGVLWIVFGILVFSRPGITVAALALVFGAFVFADGVVNVVNAVAGRRERDDWWTVLLIGLAGITVGVIAFVNPSLTALALLFYIAIWAIVTGVLEIVGAIRLRREIDGEMWLILGGLVSVGFGVFMIMRPAAGALALLWLIATFALVLGAILVVLSFRARTFTRHLGTPRMA